MIELRHLRHLRHFIVVAEELNFRRAAERIPMDQTPLSRTIRDLEDQLGALLFMRMPRHLTADNSRWSYAQGSPERTVWAVMVVVMLPCLQLLTRILPRDELIEV